MKRLKILKSEESIQNRKKKTSQKYKYQIVEYARSIHAQNRKLTTIIVAIQTSEIDVSIAC